jgi:hypothetical protein
MEDHDRREKTRPYYQLQTKLYHVEDTLVSFSSLSLTLRQCFVLILGGCGSIQVWRMLEGSLLLGQMPLLVRLIVASVPCILAMLIAMVRIADRYGEDWALVLLQYVLCPRVYLWRPHAPSVVQPSGKRHVKRQRRSRPDDQDDEQMSNQRGRKHDEDKEYDG